MKIIEVESLNYKSIFKNFNISIEKNKFTTISGSNLSGKTTLIRILSKKILTNNMVKIDNKYIEEYNISKLAETLRTVIPSDQKTFRENTIKKELEIITNHKNNLDYYKELIKLFKLTKYLNYNPNEISQKLKTKVYLVKALLYEPKILIIDDLNYYLNKNDVIEIINMLKTIKNITIVYTTDNLEETVNSDYLYILSSGEIILEGAPLKVLEKDNILNKLGLDLPFMIDLSVKLKDYDLIDSIEQDMDRMVDILWK